MASDKTKPSNKILQNVNKHRFTTKKYLIANNVPTGDSTFKAQILLTRLETTRHNEICFVLSIQMEFNPYPVI